MLLNCGVGEDSWESLGLQGGQTSQSQRKSVPNIHWKDWCWSWSFNTLATWGEELTHWKRPWCWERLKAAGKLYFCKSIQSDTAHLKKKSSRTQKYYKNTLQKYTEMNSVNYFNIRTDKYLKSWEIGLKALRFTSGRLPGNKDKGKIPAQLLNICRDTIFVLHLNRHIFNDLFIPSHHSVLCASIHLSLVVTKSSWNPDSM